jgi:transcriptional regulator with GAF, ATPase, and Fis domain
VETQAKLLRVLQEREIERVGGGAALPVDVRIIAATNRDLLEAVRPQAFREDLYYRLSVFPIALPPLRDRAKDIPLLVPFLVDKFAALVGKRIDRVSREAVRRVVGYPWPGNVRELENVLERAVILASGPTLDLESDAEHSSATAPAEDPSRFSLEAIDRRHILAVLRQTHWVIDGQRGAAQILGLHPNTLRSRLTKLGITRSAHEPP